ncbi:MAG TPA: hypothetical protein QF703_04045 [Candidatus Thalassarchaeaceae archaeon]|nr:hypothetical protein [Candidatus Thalassarchaeaceae archaeon]
MPEAVHIAIQPSKRLVSKASKSVKPKSERKGGPEFILTEEMRKLSTPWSVASIRAKMIDPLSLPAGVILDAAAGSGVQLIAYSNILKRPSLGIELDKGIAEMCAANMFLNSDGEVQRSLDRVLAGDGCLAEEAKSTYWESLRDGGARAHPPIAMLHLDPARPRDAQKHSIEEMKPNIKSLLKNWSGHLQTGPKGPAVLLDLSPRLGSIQRAMVDGILETCFPGCSRTWEWLSQGGGRVDRLSVWVGSISTSRQRRCLRIGKKRIMAALEGRPDIANTVSFSKPPDYGAWLSIVDPVLLESGLQEVWKKRAIKSGSGASWIRTEGRRPLLIHTDQLNDDPDVLGFVVSSGKIVQHRLSPPELGTIDLVASSSSRVGIGKLTLRCSLDPEVHPTLQRRLHKALADSEGDSGFMVDMELKREGGGHNLFVICKEASK